MHTSVQIPNVLFAHVLGQSLTADSETSVQDSSVRNKVR